MSLFGEHARVDPSPSLHSETTFGFLSRVSGPYWDQCRALLENWLSAYPTPHRPSLQGQLMSGDDQQFTSAFWELYLHETYRRDGWSIAIHPDVPNASTHPDFFVEKAGQGHYVEARCLFGNGDRAASARLNAVYDAVNKVDSGPFHLAVTAISIGTSSPPTRRLRTELQDWVARLDPDTVDTSLGPDNADTWEWTQGDWRIRFAPIPRSPEVRGQRVKRAIAAYVPQSAEFIDDIHPLREALEEKGRRYGDLPHPLVIAIHVASGFHDDRDTIQALFGSVGYQFDWQQSAREAVPVIIEHGYWRNSTAPTNPHVSGILLSEAMHYTGVAKYVPTFWPNPWALVEVERLPTWSVIDYQSSTLSEGARLDPETKPSRHFGIPDEWPTGPAFARK